MAIILKGDEYKGINFDSYNKLNRIELLDLSTGSGSIRMAKYANQEIREAKPSELLENRDFHTINIVDEDLKTLQDLVYKYINNLDYYKNGEKTWI